MKTAFLSAAAVLAITPAYAFEPYAGINLATPGEANFNINGRNVPNANHPRAVKLYAGLELMPAWAVEFGYGDFGSWYAAEPAAGSSYRLQLSSKIAYAAFRATMPLSDSLAFFGKLGLAQNRLSMRDSNGHSAHQRYIRPLIGGGLQWQLTPQISAVVEYANYGSRRSDGDRFTQQKLELGLSFKF